MDRDTWDNVDGPMQRRVEKTIYWVSIMDGLQRVLVFTDNKDLSCLARKVGPWVGQKYFELYKSVYVL